MTQARRGVTSLLIALAALLTVAAPALAQEEDDDYVVEEDEAAGPDTVTQGADATFTAEGYEPDTEVEVEVLSEAFTRAGTVTANAEGVASFTFEVPCTALRGQTGTVTFRGLAEGGDAILESSADFTIGGEVAACPEGLPTTGAGVTNGLLIVAAVVILGAGLVAVGRRRRDEHAEQG